MGQTYEGTLAAPKGSGSGVIRKGETVIDIQGISKTPAAKSLFMIREVKLRVSQEMGYQCDLVTRGVSTGESEKTIRAYQNFLRILGKEYRDMFGCPRYVCVRI